MNAILETETAVWPMCRQNCDGHRSSNKYNYNERQVSIGQRSVMGNLNLVVAQELWVYIYIYRYVYIYYIYMCLFRRVSRCNWSLVAARLKVTKTPSDGGSGQVRARLAFRGP